MEREEVMKELASIRETLQDCTRRLNAFSDLRDDANGEEIESTQIGLTQTFELALASEESVTDTLVALAELYEMIIEGGEEE